MDYSRNWGNKTEPANVSATQNVLLRKNLPSLSATGITAAYTYRFKK